MNCNFRFVRAFSRTRSNPGDTLSQLSVCGVTACSAFRLAPSPPPLFPQLCSATWSLLPGVLTAPDRASSATTHSLPDADHQRTDGQLGALPAPGQGTYTHAGPYDHAELDTHSRFRTYHVAFRQYQQRRRSGLQNFRGFITRPVYAPTDASPPVSRPTTHGLGSIWFARPCILEDFQSVFLAGFSGALVHFGWPPRFGDFERRVKCADVFVVGHRPKEVVFDITVYSLDTTLFVALRRSCEFDVERKAATKRGEGLVLIAIASAQNPPYRRRCVVEDRRARQATKCRKRSATILAGGVTPTGSLISGETVQTPLTRAGSLNGTEPFFVS